MLEIELEFTDDNQKDDTTLFIFALTHIPSLCYEIIYNCYWIHMYLHLDQPVCVNGQVCGYNHDYALYDCNATCGTPCWIQPTLGTAIYSGLDCAFGNSTCAMPHYIGKFRALYATHATMLIISLIQLLAQPYLLSKNSKNHAYRLSNIVTVLVSPLKLTLGVLSLRFPNGCATELSMLSVSLLAKVSWDIVINILHRYGMKAKTFIVWAANAGLVSFTAMGSCFLLMKMKDNPIPVYTSQGSLCDYLPTIMDYDCTTCGVNCVIHPTQSDLVFSGLNCQSKGNICYIPNTFSQYQNAYNLIIATFVFTPFSMAFGFFFPGILLDLPAAAIRISAYSMILVSFHNIQDVAAVAAASLVASCIHLAIAFSHKLIKHE